MLEIAIAGKETGRKALMYSALQKRGLRRLVPTYAATVKDKAGEVLFEFAVTRKCRREVFGGGKPHDYRQGGECPPSMSLHPYMGRVTTAGRLGFAIMLYETWCPKQESLRGRGRHARQGIKIHQGPACSFGCMAVAGGQKGYRRFKETFETLQETYGTVFQVIVMERIS